MRHVLSGLHLGGALKMELREAAPTANAMVVVVSYWLSYEYVRDPRHALEPDRAGAALMRGAFHALEPAATLPRACVQGPPLQARRPVPITSITSITTLKETIAMAKWTAFPYDNSAFVYTAATLKKHWARLHAGDAEPFPKDSCRRAGLDPLPRR